MEILLKLIDAYTLLWCQNLMHSYGDILVTTQSVTIKSFEKYVTVLALSFRALFS